MAEIREGHNSMSSDAQHLAQHFQRRARFLQSLAEDHIIERLIGQIRERLFNIARTTRSASSNRLALFRARDSDPPRIDIFLRGEPGEHLSRAAKKRADA